MLDQVADKKSSYDKDDARAVVIIEPFRPSDRVVNEMLNAMDHKPGHSMWPRSAFPSPATRHCRDD